MAASQDSGMPPITKLRVSKPRRWRKRNGLIVPTGEAVAEALATVPKGMPWPWACLRVFPQIRGTRIAFLEDEEMEHLGFAPAGTFPSLPMDPGVEVTLCIEVSPALITVAQEQLDAWEMRIDEVVPAALANLRRSVAGWTPSIKDDSYAGMPVRILREWEHWALTLVLLPDALKRIFGPQDQLFIAPYHCNLISLPIDADRDAAADLVDLWGLLNPQSLLLGVPAVALRSGVLSVEELPGFEEFPDDDHATDDAGEW